MAYNPYSAVEAIYNYKKQWDEGNQAGDEAKKKDAADRAKAYYEQLRGNGYADVAEALSASNYAQSKAIRDKWAKMGKTSANDYLRSLGGAKGMSQSDIDKLITVDELTGELSFGGKKIGTPDSVVDGVSYWSDTSVLDNAFSDYVSRAGVTPSSVNSTEVKDKINDLWGTQKNDREMMTGKYNTLESYNYDHNPYEDEIGKSIMEDYKWQGQRASESEVASGAGDNGGNIDSFAAANAARQQVAFTNAGKQAVLNDFNTRIANARSILSDMGVYLQNQDINMQNTIQIQQDEAQRQFDNDETAKNNETTRLSEQAAVSGVTPAEWTIKNDAFLKNFVDENGKLKTEYINTDFQALINKAKAEGNTELANKYAILRGLKIFGNFAEYGKYLNEGDVAYVQPQKTEAARQFDENIALSDRTLTAEPVEYKPTLTATQALAAVKSGNVTDETIAAYNYYYGGGYTVNNPPRFDDVGNLVKIDPAAEAAKAVSTFKSSVLAKDEFLRRGGKVNKQSYKAYDDYIMSTAEEWYFNGNLSEDAFADVIISYGLGDRYGE